LGVVEKGQLVKSKLQRNPQNKDAGKAILVEFSHHLNKRALLQRYHDKGCKQNAFINNR
jgi:hypothetical protein